MMTTLRAVSKLDRVLDEAMRSAPKSGEGTPTFPVAADIREQKDAYALQFDLPGVRLEDIHVTLESHMLTLRGERRFERGQQERVTCGRPYGEFALSYALPDGIDGENLTADLADGVLTVRVPKQPQAQPRKILITSGGANAPMSNDPPHG